MYREIAQDVAGRLSETEIEATATAEWSDPRASEQARRAASSRKQSGRRRKVDPTTSERDYSAEELEFMDAMQRYKQRSGRMFPTWSEVLEVLQSLGYRKPSTTGNPPDSDSGSDDRPGR